MALYGLCPDYDPILELCKEHGIVLIEDNAECFLGEYCELQHKCQLFLIFYIENAERMENFP